MRQAIAKAFPEHGVIGEEFAPQAGAGRFHWILDPIDGTRAFMIGSPMWGTLIALTEHGRPVLGVMNQPFTRERFWAAGGVARMQGPTGRPTRLKTRTCARLEDAVLTTTHPDLFADLRDRARFAELKGRVLMTRFGGDCYGYCLLAAGFVDLIIEVGLKPYDVMALIPIIEARAASSRPGTASPRLKVGASLPPGIRARTGKPCAFWPAEATRAAG